MKLVSLFRITASVIIAQIALGGLVTFGFIDPLVHMLWGFFVTVVAMVTGFVTLRSRPTDRGLRGVSAGLIVAILAQVALGFTTLALASNFLAWVHLVLGVLVYAMAITGMGFAQRQEYMSLKGTGLG